MIEIDINDGNEAAVGAAERMPLLAIARTIFLGWEKLRPGYVIIAAAWCLFLFQFGGMDADALQFWMTCIVGGLLANLCYFAGPIVESYVAWLGWRHHVWMRPVLFLVGTVFTLLLAMAALFPRH